jgi:uncharacterized protein
MHQGLRLIFFLLTITLAIALLAFWPAYLPVSPTVKIVLFTTLITAAFAAALIEHFFTKPTDVVANATAVLLLLLPAHPDLEKFGWWFWAIVSYYISAISVASVSILIFSFANPDNEDAHHAARTLKAIAVRAGSFKIIYSVAFFSTLFLYVKNTTPTFLVLAAYFVAVLVLEPGQAIRSISRAWKQRAVTPVGDVIGVQSKNVFLAKLRPNRPALTRFQPVTFRYKLDDTVRECLIVDSYLLNDEQWIKMVPIGPSELDLSDCEPNVVYHDFRQQNPAILARMIGLITNGTSIGLIKFEYASRNRVFQGKLVEVPIGAQNILYQIVQGTAVETVLERKNKSGAITGEAAQLGIWNAQTQRFERFGWVPEINALVLEPSEPNVNPIGEGELRLGDIPGTLYPVIMNVDDAITHHLAIFGVTGSGKSVFARWLLKQYIERDVIVLCVDNTLEYQRKLPPDIWTSVISNDQNDVIRNNVNVVAREMEKFANQRNMNDIRNNERQARDAFVQAIGQLQPGKIGILNLPDLQSTIEGLEYIRLFFSSVFQMARAGAFGNKRVCIVLEEAHTLVPEWNFNSGDEKRSQALVNTISQIALQGRKHNIGLMVIGQRTANVAKTVLTQCNSVVAFQQFDPTGLEFFSHYMGREFADGLSVLENRRAVAVGKAFAAGVPLIFQVPDIDENLPAEEGDDH